MKRILALLLSMVLILSGCSSNLKTGESINLEISQAENYEEFKELYVKNMIDLFPRRSSDFPENVYEDIENVKSRIYTASEEEQERVNLFYKNALDKLNEFDKGDKNDLDYLSIKWMIEMLNKGVEFEKNNNPFYGVSTPFSEINEIFTKEQIIDDEESAREFISRLKMADDYLLNTLWNFEKNIEEGFVSNLKYLSHSYTILYTYYLKKPKNSEIYKYFEESIEPLNIRNKDKLLLEVEEIITNEYNPALNIIKDTLKENYLSSNDVIGISELPWGKEYYEYIVKYNTTLNITPEELMNIAMGKITDLKPEFEDELKKLEDNSINYKETVNEILSKQTIIQEAEIIMEEAYKNLYKILPERFLPKTIPDIVSTTGNNHYTTPSFDFKRKGTVNINLNKRYNKLQFKNLVYYQAVPGQHLEREYFLRNKNTEGIKRLLSNTAYIEGWAEYSQKLAYEFEFYNDPIVKIYDLEMELQLAIYIALDIGINYYGWEEYEIVGFISNNELDEYVNHKGLRQSFMALPGQVLSYGVGRWKILELRDKAKSELGDQFDIKEFNGWILEEGPMPLDVLEMYIENKIKDKL